MTMHNPAHPCEIHKGLVIKPLELAITDVATHLAISRKKLSKLVNCRACTTSELAVRLELVFGKPSAHHWLRHSKCF